MTTLIKRNSTVPAKITETFSTFADNQSGVLVKLFEGEQIMSHGNNLLGKFNLDGDHPQVNVCFDIDDNGILNVSGLEESTGEEITITIDKGRLSQYEIEDMVNEAEKYKAEDDVIKNCVKAKNDLEIYCFSLRSYTTEVEFKARVPEEDKTALIDAIHDAITWLDANHQTAKKEDFEERHKALTGIANPIFSAFYN
mmetsp:Transcript_11297/g.24841  ORF Transcript_11297/g.24841 Transcript_11297/m.24841 type:complete len:197 (+) Transcript_11297:1-591(+)